jgi:hypothetical protein
MEMSNRQELLNQLNQMFTEKSEKANEQLGCIQRALELEVSEDVVSTAVVTKPVVKKVTPKATKTETAPQQPTAPADGQPRKRGRPPGSKNKPKEATQGGEGEAAQDGKTPDLPTLLVTFGQQINKPMSNADYVKLVLEAGYKSEAKDFSNMVYQALQKLVKRGTFKKNEETRQFEFVNKAA